jgi:uncharacterized protein YutE (UPF0331/DUF86 family)
MTLSEDDLERVLAAVETIEGSLEILARKRPITREAYRNDRETQDIVERRFVKTTEAALDIAETVAVHETGTRPESNPAAMRALADAGIVGESIAEPMAQAARFRNVLAHTYGNIIDHDVVYDALQDLERYRDFLVAIRNYLDEIGALEESTTPP